MSKIFMVLGKSASGKDTIFKRLKNNHTLGLSSVVGYTTRPIRRGEKDGEEYRFVSRERLEALIKENKVIEHRSYNTMHGLWNYFTVDDGQIDIEKSNYILIGTLKAYEQIRKYYGPDVVVPLYIEVEDGLRLYRALSRERKQENPKYSELCRRFLADDEDFKEDNLNKLMITKRYQNHDMKACLIEIVEDVKSMIRNTN